MEEILKELARAGGDICALWAQYRAAQADVAAARAKAEAEKAAAFAAEVKKVLAAFGA